MGWIDITQILHNNIPVWPGDTEFTFSLCWTKEESGSVNVGKIEMSTHTGTHIDAPYHFDQAGKKVLDLELERYLGKAVVVDVSNLEKISVDDVIDLQLDGIDKILFKTLSWKDRQSFPQSITFIGTGVAQVLANKGIKLIGVDTPSVDPIDSKELEAHHELLHYDIHILEGINLDNVKEGLYELIALPLAIKDGDASPVRAIIRPI